MFPSMPAAVSPSIVDARADLEAIGRRAGRPPRGDRRRPARPGPRSGRCRCSPPSSIGSGSRSGIDFGAYKSATIVRRLRGRMQRDGQRDRRRLRGARRARPCRVRPARRQPADQGHRVLPRRDGCGTTCATTSCRRLVDEARREATRAARLVGRLLDRARRRTPLAIDRRRRRPAAADPAGRRPHLRDRRRPGRDRLRPPRRLPGRRAARHPGRRSAIATSRRSGAGFEVAKPAPRRGWSSASTT